jgi:hypothetical protein
VLLNCKLCPLPRSFQTSTTSLVLPYSYLCTSPHVEAECHFDRSENSEVIVNSSSGNEPVKENRACIGSQATLLAAAHGATAS